MNWSEWGPWGQCSKSCGFNDSHRSRIRYCKFSQNGAMRAMMEKNNVNTCPQELEKEEEKCVKIEVKSYEF